MRQELTAQLRAEMQNDFQSAPGFGSAPSRRPNRKEERAAVKVKRATRRPSIVNRLV
jgi:hypothetical protein